MNVHSGDEQSLIFEVIDVVVHSDFYISLVHHNLTHRIEQFLEAFLTSEFLLLAKSLKQSCDEYLRHRSGPVGSISSEDLRNMLYAAAIRFAEKLLRQIPHENDDTLDRFRGKVGVFLSLLHPHAQNQGECLEVCGRLVQQFYVSGGGKTEDTVHAMQIIEEEQRDLSQLFEIKRDILFNWAISRSSLMVE